MVAPRALLGMLAIGSVVALLGAGMMTAGEPTPIPGLPGTILPIALSQRAAECFDQTPPYWSGGTDEGGTGWSNSYSVNTGVHKAKVAVADGLLGNSHAWVFPHGVAFDTTTDADLQWSQSGWGSVSIYQTGAGNGTIGGAGGIAENWAIFYVASPDWTATASGTNTMAFRDHHGAGYGTSSGNPNSKWSHTFATNPELGYLGLWGVSSQANAELGKSAIADSDVTGNSLSWCYDAPT